MKAARADGDRDLAARIGALQKPSVGAWLVDALVRETPEDLDRVLQVGAALEEAQSAGDRDRLRALARERRSVISEVAEAAAQRAEAAGQRVGDAAREAMQETLRAALTDPNAAAAVRTGRLVRALTGDGDDLDAAVAGGAPEPAAVPRRTGDREAERRAAERRRAAEQRARDAEDAARTAAETERDRHQEVADLRARLDELQEALDAAERAHADAAKAARRARQEADAASAEVDRLTDA